MQTFLPYSDFEQSASILDDKRLGKQRVEAKQILNALQQGPKVMYRTDIRKCVYGAIPEILPPHTKIRVTPWHNHPASLIWINHKHALAKYAFAVCKIWRSRGYEDSLLPWFEQFYNTQPDTGMPDLIGFEPFHESHASNLCKKYPEHYRKFFPNIPDNLPYVWKR